MFTELYSKLEDYASQVGIVITYEVEYSYYHRNTINVCPRQVGAAMQKLNISSDEIFCLILAHELGHALNAYEVGYKWGCDEVLAWSRGLQLITDLGFPEPSNYKVVRDHYLASYGIIVS